MVKIKIIVGSPSCRKNLEVGSNTKFDAITKLDEERNWGKRTIWGQLNPQSGSSP